MEARKMNRTLAILAASTIVVSIAVAQGKPGDKPASPPAAPPANPAAAPKPPPELDAGFKYFEGAWKCDTKMPAGAMGPNSPEMTAKSTVHFKKAFGGFFYQGDYEMKKQKGVPGFKGMFLISYQPAAKVFTLTSSDDTGGATYETSPGFVGETITLTGEGYMMGQKLKVRETMTRKGPKGASHTFEADLGKGFQNMGEDDCTR
jgi:hypothetical protein